MSARLRLVVVPALAAVLAGCNVFGTPVTTIDCAAGAPCASFETPSGSPTPVALTVGLGYIPSVQFAPFYLAQQEGLYAQSGLSVTFQNKIETDLVLLVGQGSIDIGVADGTDVIPAVSQGVPVKYVATLYGRFPSIVFAKASSGISEAADLKGKKIGIPGKYGSSWVMLQALLGSAKLTTADVTVIEYPDFGQGAAVQQGAVDAATGFANNEPVQLKLAGIDVSVLHVDDVVALPGPGLIVGNAALASKREAIAAFVRATLQAMDEVAADPTKGVDASIAAAPDLGKNRDTQMAILVATIRSWSRDSAATSGFGAIDRPGWQASIDFMTTLKLLAKPVTVDDLVDASLLPVTVDDLVDPSLLPAGAASPSP